MPWVEIGSCGWGQLPGELDRVLMELSLGMTYLHHVCGDPPGGSELGIMWCEHELGEYPLIGLCYPGPGEPPWEYINNCEHALGIFDDAVDWGRLDPYSVQQGFEELPSDDDEEEEPDDEDDEDDEDDYSGSDDDQE